MVQRMQQDLGLEMALARWVLGELAPELVPELAVQAVQAGCEAPSVVLLAGQHAPTEREIEDELVGVFRETGLTPPTEMQALKVIVDECASRIVSGSVAPLAGARELWQRAPSSTRDFAVWEQLRPFIGYASEWEDHEEGRSTYEAGIVASAQALLDAGGLQGVEK